MDQTSKWITILPFLDLLGIGNRMFDSIEFTQKLETPKNKTSKIAYLNLDHYSFQSPR